MGEKNIVLLSWDNHSAAYEAFSKFRDSDLHGVRVEGSVVIERNTDGALRVTDGQDNEIGLASLAGGTLGALIGILGGPLGMIAGFASGGLIGSAFDLDRAIDSESVISTMSQALAPGRSGVLAEVDEDSPAPLDQFALDSGATLLRRRVDDVLDEVGAAEDAADAAARAAHKEFRESKKAEHKAKRDERIERVKARLDSDR